MLYLYNNLLTSLDPATFNSLINLRTFRFIYNNQLTSLLPLTFSRLTKLRLLRLNNNNLISIDRQSFLGLTNLEIVYLANNPISSTQQSYVTQLCLSNPKCIICLFDSCNKQEHIL